MFVSQPNNAFYPPAVDTGPDCPYYACMRFCVIPALAALLCCATTALAQQYRWTDEMGRVRFTDTPPPPTAKNITKTATPAKPAATAEAPLPFEVLQASKDFPVTLYTAPALICKQYCESARLVLNRRGVPFTELQVWDPEAVAKLKTATGSENIPAIVVGRTVASGFDEARYDGLLDSAGYPKTGSAPARAQAAPAAPAGFEPPPQAEPVKPAAGRPGPYDTSGLKSNVPEKPGVYDPAKAGLPDNSKPPGPYGVPSGTSGSK